MQVVFAGRLVELPGGPGEERLPVVRLGFGGPGHHALARRTPPVPVPLRTIGPGTGFDEPWVLVGGVVDDQVHEDLDAASVGRGEQLVEVGEGAKGGVDVLVVADVVAVVVLGRAVDRAEPEHVDPELSQVVELGDDAGQVADAVAVRVHEAARVDLVDDGPRPPRVGAGRGAGVEARPRAGAHGDGPFPGGRPGTRSRSRSDHPNDSSGGGPRRPAERLVPRARIGPRRRTPRPWNGVGWTGDQQSASAAGHARWRSPSPVPGVRDGPRPQGS